jgi:cyclic pyranopterin phosphate synthase
MGCKKTSDIIPLCHPLLLDRIGVTLTPHAESSSLECRVIVECQGRTGVEMEALTGVMAGLVTVWDMLKAVAGKEMKIYDVMVVKKFGGISGGFERPEYKSTAVDGEREGEEEN